MLFSDLVTPCSFYRQTDDIKNKRQRFFSGTGYRHFFHSSFMTWNLMWSYCTSGLPVHDTGRSSARGWDVPTPNCRPTVKSAPAAVQLSLSSNTRHDGKPLPRVRPRNAFHVGTDQVPTCDRYNISFVSLVQIYHAFYFGTDQIPTCDGYNISFVSLVQIYHAFYFGTDQIPTCDGYNISFVSFV